jgi:hypothetical protein
MNRYFVQFDYSNYSNLILMNDNEGKIKFIAVTYFGLAQISLEKRKKFLFLTNFVSLINVAVAKGLFMVSATKP